VSAEPPYQADTSWRWAGVGAVLIALMLATLFGSLDGPDELTDPPNLHVVEVTQPFQVEKTIRVPAAPAIDAAQGASVRESAGASAPSRVTLRVENANESATLILTRVQLEDSGGHVVETFVDRAHALGPRETAEFFPKAGSAGSDAKFLLTWGLLEAGADPILEVVHQAQADSTRGPTVIERLAEIELFSNETP
jgi:hypothetical protein